ncbi:DNA topoisomerase 1 [Sodalis praecaptivus]
MGIDPYHGWKAQYEVLPGKEKVVTELKALAEKADHIYLATDLDREGEAIAWHLREVIGGDDKRFSRVVFNEITRNAIAQAFEQPGELNIDRVNAQQARRFMDRVVGYMVSPLLWKKSPVACRLDGSNRWRCGWSWSASGKSKPLCRKSIGNCTPIYTRRRRLP